MKQLLLEAFKFGVVGVVGFVVDTGVLYLLKGALGLYYARVISFICAVIATWLLNRAFTFAQAQVSQRRSKEFLLYFLFMCLGGVINIGCYMIVINYFSLAHSWPVIAVAVGSIAGMFSNFFMSRTFIYKRIAVS
ncbi:MULTISPECIES: GtrA family protein [Pantoea]|jgi:Predicted membrane protein|uniref:GtrA family protein n=1 Tax=Candidatus Pantoea multigeneris TaxID=2608357 RepID=A0ABX0RJ63_9GAMM|nr:MULTISPECIES: GtrA family protein [Pantoea]NIF24183.1 GtrA family protein [Pantoea multigeneris]